MGSSLLLDSLKIKTVTSLIRETWAILPTSLLKKNLTYSSIFKVHFMKSFAAAKASLVFMNNRCRCCRSQMFFKIGVLKNFAAFTGKHLCWSLFLIKLLAFRCFPVNVAKLLRPDFFIEHLWWFLLQMFCFTLYFQKKRCWIYCSFTLHNCFIVKPKITRICFHSLYHSFSFLVTGYHSLSLVAPHVVTRYHSLSLDASLLCLFINDLKRSIFV